MQTTTPIGNVLENQAFVEEYRRTQPQVRRAAVQLGTLVANHMLSQRPYMGPFTGHAAVMNISHTALRTILGKRVFSYVHAPDMMGFQDMAAIISDYCGIHMFHGIASPTDATSVVWFIEADKLESNIEANASTLANAYRKLTDKTMLTDLTTWDAAMGDDEDEDGVSDDEDSEEEGGFVDTDADLEAPPRSKAQTKTEVFLHGTGLRFNPTKFVTAQTEPSDIEHAAVGLPKRTRTTSSTRPTDTEVDKAYADQQQVIVDCTSRRVKPPRAKTWAEIRDDMTPPDVER